MDANRLIGVQNRLPWHLSADLRRFRQITMHHALIMGRYTYESLGRPLDGRLNIVMTRQARQYPPSVKAVADLATALAIGQEYSDETLAIGGARIYRLCLPLARRIHLTRLHATFEGDAWFPEIEPSDWREIEREDFPARDDVPFGYSFCTLDRVAK